MKKTWIAPLLLLLTAAGSALGAEGLLNKLLAPGPLMEGHHQLEKVDCLECHEAGKGVPASKCMACHKEIRAQLDRKGGYHGLQTKTCIQCHSDHKGREYDSTRVDPKKFDHKQTGYILEGKHADIKCEDCHTEKRGDLKGERKKTRRLDEPHYLGLQASCISCHKKESPHYFVGKFADKDCNSCHGMKKWTVDVKFDHEKDGHYKLVGKHAKLKCSECHVTKDKKGIYKWPSLEKQQCLSCHKDQHGDNLGRRFTSGAKRGDCTTCHSQSQWKIPDFDHSITRYALKGRHAEIKCEDCHKQSPSILNKGRGHFKFTGLKQDCLSCHKDQHLFGPIRSAKLGVLNQCSSCHTDRAWKPSKNFNHSVDTRFEIGGKHVGVKCEACHVPSKVERGVAKLRVYHWPRLAEKTCENCHKSPHLKSFSRELLAKRCTECHVDEGWKVFKKDKATFDHDKSTRFKLTGKHAKTSCNACHVVGDKQVFKFPNAEKGFCIDCHDNIHVGQFKSKFSDQSCAACHTTTDFKKRLPFDHSSTDFAITGKHKQAKCEDCHVPTGEMLDVRPPRPKSKFIFAHSAEKYCVDCHANVHLGQFHGDFSNRSCTVCHTTDNFTRRLDFDHNQSAFKLKGKHQEVQCSKCHVPTAQKFPDPSRTRMHVFRIPQAFTRDCAACHKDVHDGNYGSKCSECHTEQTWKQSKDFHKGFSLSGVHYSLECAECHKDGKQLAGMSQACTVCHQKDDIHAGTLPNCGDCHRQQFWENPHFIHSMSNFPLRGIHRTLDCASCHDRGIYKGTQSRCIDCHRSAALAVTPGGGVPDHSLLLNRSCSECHNQFSFK